MHGRSLPATVSACTFDGSVSRVRGEGAAAALVILVGALFILCADSHVAMLPSTVYLRRSSGRVVLSVLC